MSRKIHHGSNGSYKTSGALNDDLMNAVSSGRTVISNVRGLEDKDAIIRTWYLLQPLSKRILWRFFPEKAPLFEFDLIYLDTEDKDYGEENLEKMRRFAEWAPEGAFIIFDEVDEIYDPQLFTASYLKNYDYPPVISEETGEIIKTSKQASIEAGRFATLKVAFSKHRHMNWDMIFTCTSIDNVHPMIRKGADMAYRHFNMANSGIMGKGKYREIAHTPDNRGSSESNEMSNVIKKIPSQLFNIYKSTSTGNVQDTIAGTSLWKGNKKLRYMTYFVVALIIKSFWDIPYLMDQLGGKNNDNTQESSIPKTEEKKIIKSTDKNTKIHFVVSSKEQNNQKTSSVSNSSVHHEKFDKTLSFIDYFLGESLVMAGRFNKENTYLRKENSKTIFNLNTIKEMGIKVVWVNAMSGFLIYKDRVIPFQPEPQKIADFCCLEKGGTSTPKIQINTPKIN